jgi:hypothetical protein
VNKTSGTLSVDIKHIAESGTTGRRRGRRYHENPASAPDAIGAARQASRAMEYDIGLLNVTLNQ